MRLDKTDIVCGLRAPVVRSLMRELMHRSLSSAAVGEFLADENARLTEPVETVMRRLADEGYVTTAGPHGQPRTLPDEWDEFASNDDSIPLWRTTTTGNALAKASFYKPISRDRALGYVEGVVERAQAVNDDPDFLYWVESVEVFGSVTDSGATEVGDVDLRAVCTPRIKDRDEFQKRVYEAAEASGRRFGTIVDVLAYPDRQVLRFLRGRSNRVDLQLDTREPRPLPDGADPIIVYTREDGAQLDRLLEGDT